MYVVEMGLSAYKAGGKYRIHFMYMVLNGDATILANGRIAILRSIIKLEIRMIFQKIPHYAEGLLILEA